MLVPFLLPLPYATTFVSLSITLVMVSALGAMKGTKWVRGVGGGLLLLAILGVWFHWGESPGEPDFSSMSVAGFLGLVVHSFGRYLLRLRRVDANMICAALCFYLIVGLFWGSLYAVLESFQPHSFSSADLSLGTGQEEVRHRLQYFSFVTLTTLGYGDISPATRAAAALCQTEAIIGQFITVVLVARLVGIHAAQGAVESKDEESP